MTSLRRALLGLGIAGFVAGVVPLLTGLDSHDGKPNIELVALFGPLITWAFIGTGLYAWWRQPENRIGVLMTIVGFAWAVGGLSVSPEPGVFIVGYALAPFGYAVLLHLLLAFPNGMLHSRTERVIVGGAYVVTTLVHWLHIPFFDTTRDWCSCPQNPLLADRQDLVADVLLGFQSSVGFVAVAAVAVLLARRWRSSSPAQRGPLAPVLAMGMGLAVLLAATLLADVTPFSDELESYVDIAGMALFLAVPFAFLAGLTRSHLSRAAGVRELMTGLAGRADERDGLRDALARALRDPSLALAFWLPESRRYVDSSGAQVEVPPSGPALACTEIEHDGRPLAAIIHDASLAEHRELVRAAGAAAALALQNERLGAELRAKVEELRESRARIVESGDAERRRLERDLHDGAQQRLVSLALNLRLARARLGDDPVAAKQLLESSADELELALADLRELARGIHPAVLSDRGLPAALEGLASRAPVPVKLSNDSARLPEPVEAAAYFVVAEALTNVAKYAHASKAMVQVRRDNGRLVVEVSDDGDGGADPSKGSGLRGLSDRVAALDGRLEVDSVPGRGTVVRARIPCG